MMERRTSYRPVNPRWFNRLLSWSYGAWLRLAYGLEAKGLGLFEELKPPYVLLGNHLTTRDPFWIGILLGEPVWWVASDGNMRTRLMRSLLRLVGTIPKSKLIPDRETVNLIVDVVRKKRGVVGLFPEGQQSWDGRTQALIPATAKLVKLLKVPVVTVLIKGGWYALPRWARTRRRGRVEVEFSLLAGAEELGKLSAEEVGARLEGALAHDEYAWQQTRRQPFRGARRAEHLELSLYACPSCESLGSLESAGSAFRCGSCGLDLALDRYGEFRGRDAAPPFRGIRDWDLWQAGALGGILARLRAAAGGGALVADGGTLLLKGRKMKPLRLVGKGTLELRAEGLSFRPERGEGLAFPLERIEGANVLKRDLFEFYVGRDLWQLRWPDRPVSARKWLDCVETLRRAEA